MKWYWFFCTVLVLVFSLFSSCGTTGSGKQQEDKQEPPLKWDQSLIMKKNTETDSFNLPFWEDNNRAVSKPKAELIMTKTIIDDGNLSVTSESPSVSLMVKYKNRSTEALKLNKWFISFEAVNDETIEARVWEEPLERTLESDEEITLNKEISIRDPYFENFTNAGGNPSKGIYFQNAVSYSSEESGGMNFVITKHRIDK